MDGLEPCGQPVPAFAATSAYVRLLRVYCTYTWLHLDRTTLHHPLCGKRRNRGFLDRQQACYHGETLDCRLEHRRPYCTPTTSCSRLKILSRPALGNGFSMFFRSPLASASFRLRLSTRLLPISFSPTLSTLQLELTPRSTDRTPFSMLWPLDRFISAFYQYSVGSG